MSEINKNNKCVYLHKDKKGVVRYVGSGTLKRAYKACANSDRGKKYAEFVAQNGRLEVEIIAEGLSKIEAEDLERLLYDENFVTVLNARRPVSARLISKEMFDEYLYYDETSPSCLRWKVDVVGGNCAVKIKANSEAGSLNKNNGYYQVQLQGVRYQSHRIVALLHNLGVDDFVIDHIDRDKSNNKISNLRLVSQKENMQNKNQYKLSSNNTTGVQGVSYSKQRDYWVAGWYENGNRIRKHFPIKNYETSEAAFEAAVEYRQQMVNLHYS